jgi:hypothetical protein
MTLNEPVAKIARNGSSLKLAPQKRASAKNG